MHKCLVRVNKHDLINYYNSVKEIVINILLIDFSYILLFAFDIKLRNLNE